MTEELLDRARRYVPTFEAALAKSRSLTLAAEAEPSGEGG